MSGLLELFGLGHGGVASVAGAGGKTTLIYRLASEARAAALRVIVTTTTHMGTLAEATTGPVLVEEDGDPGPALVAALDREGRATILGRRVRPDKLEGIAAERVDALAALADLVLVEADGARGRSLKAPAEHEPVVPESTTLLIVVAALDVLGAALTDASVHRPERVALAAGLGAGERIDEPAVAATLRWPIGYASRLRASVPGAVFLNKAESDAGWTAASRLASALVPPYAFVVAGSARSGIGRRWP